MTRDAALQWIIGWTFRRDVALSAEARDDLLAALMLTALTARSEGFRDGVEAAKRVADAQALHATVCIGLAGAAVAAETARTIAKDISALSPRETDAAPQEQLGPVDPETRQCGLATPAASAPSSEVAEMVRRLEQADRTQRIGDGIVDCGPTLFGEAAALLSKVGQGLDRALKNEAAFHCLLYHCQQALSMHGPHSFDEELSKGVKAAIAISHGERSMSLHFDNDWLRKTTEADPDVDIEAGHDISSPTPPERP